MALKTFNVDKATYKKFSEFCKEQGISMSKQIELFMRFFIEPQKSKEYLERIERMKKR